MNDEGYRQKIELEVLQIIESRLGFHRMDADRAKRIAWYVLETLRPQMNAHQIYTIVTGMFNLDKPLELLPSEKQKNVAPDQWDRLWNELYELYPLVVNFYADENSQSNKTKISRFVELFYLLTPKSFEKYYRELNPDFFEWVGKSYSKEGEF
jgi:hypothetical protein